MMGLSAHLANLQVTPRWVEQQMTWRIGLRSGVSDLGTKKRSASNQMRTSVKACTWEGMIACANTDQGTTGYAAVL